MATLTGDQVADHDAAGPAVHDDQLEHLVPGVHRDVAERDLPLQRLVRAEQQLLPGLAAGVERAGHLGAAERAVVKQAAVFRANGTPCATHWSMMLAVTSASRTRSTRGCPIAALTVS